MNSVSLVLACVAALIGGGGIVGCLSWVFGSGRTTGRFESRMDQILQSVALVGVNVEEIKATLREQDKRLGSVETTIARLDERSGVHHIHRRAEDSKGK